jgi:hypothetical protein
LTLCSCCKQALIEPLGWLDLEEVVARLRLLEKETTPQLRQSICPVCADAVRSASGNGTAA